jgi:hypothetical protein
MGVDFSMAVSDSAPAGVKPRATLPDDMRRLLLTLKHSCLLVQRHLSDTFSSTCGIHRSNRSLKAQLKKSLRLTIIALGIYIPITIQ